MRDKTGCVPVARGSVVYTEDVLLRFYPGIVDRAPKDWAVFVELFETGPCLATLWSGDGASRKIPRIKGATHPAHCDASTIRGRFWCDNPTTNLVHVSDDGEDARREVEILRELEPELLRAPVGERSMPPFVDEHEPRPEHSAILTLCEVVKEQISDPPPLELPKGGASRTTMTRAESWLAKSAVSGALGRAIESYLTGTAQPESFIEQIGRATSLTDWQTLVLRAGVLSRGAWLS